MSKRTKRPTTRRADPFALFTPERYGRIRAADRLADAWLADHDVDPPVDHRGRLAYRLSTGTATVARAEMVRPVEARPLTGERLARALDNGSTVVTAWDGTVYDAADRDALGNDPAFEFVTQHATTTNRDRHAFTAYVPTTARRVVPRGTVPEGTSDVEAARLRAAADGRTYVAALVPTEAPDACEQRRASVALVTAAVRPQRTTAAVLVRHVSPHSGRTYSHVHSVPVYRSRRATIIGTAGEANRLVGRLRSPRQARLTKRAGLGYWSEASYAAAGPIDADGLVRGLVYGAAAVNVLGWQERPLERSYAAAWSLSAPTVRTDQERTATAVVEALVRSWGEAPAVFTLLGRAWTLGASAAALIGWQGPTVDYRPDRVTVGEAIPATVAARHVVIDQEHRTTGATAWHPAEPRRTAEQYHQDTTRPTAEVTRGALLARVAASPAAASWVGRLLAACDQASVDPRGAAIRDAGIVVTLDHDAPSSRALILSRPATGEVWSGSWRGRRALVRLVACSTLV